jgi:hypothetical protein
MVLLCQNQQKIALDKKKTIRGIYVFNVANLLNNRGVNKSLEVKSYMA